MQIVFYINGGINDGSVKIDELVTNIVKYFGLGD